MNRFFTTLATSLLLLSLVDGARADQAGWRQITIGASGTSPPIVVALYYPTRAPSRTVAMGPFMVQVAVQAPPEATVKGLIVLSHGTGGSELAHSSLAEALARDGYLVAALRHPGDNWQDRSLLKDRSGAYFRERPRQVTRVIDALLGDPQWSERIARDASGPRIGAVGHSAGGYTVLALAGGSPDLSRLVGHCSDEAADDPIFCELSTRERRSGAAPSIPAPIPSVADPRVRAVVALAPLGVVFTAQSLAAVRIPVALYEAEDDRFLVPRFHAEWVARNVPGVQMHRVADAWHFAFVDPPTMAIGSEDGDIAADPSGFDRRAFLEQLAREIPTFFDRAFP
ncbi:MAG TPA: dienelactone hydrolase [Caldimonas sp.]|jgi:predicted dienelactone hydrolase